MYSTTFHKCLSRKQLTFPGSTENDKKYFVILLSTMVKLRKKLIKINKLIVCLAFNKIWKTLQIHWYLSWCLLQNSLIPLLDAKIIN